MRKTLASASIAVLAVAAAGIATATTASATEPGARPDRATALARGADALTAQRTAIRGAAAEKYTARDTMIDASGASHVRYDRTYQGLSVRGGDFVVHNAPGGAFAGASVAQAAPISVGTAPSVTAAQATTTARAAFSGKAESVSGAQLIVDAASGPAALAWSVRVRGVKPNREPSELAVVVDALTGQVRARDEHVETVTGSGKSLYSGTVSLDTTGSGSSFTLTDPAHGNGRTCDAGNTESATCTNFTDTDNVWGTGTISSRQSAAVDAHYGAAKTFDFYKNVLGRNGIKNDGKGVPSVVHYGDSLDNAYWDNGQMFYGDGSNNDNPFVALDVAGHEMSHGVTEATANLDYVGESGGLNEATSDIFGTMVEYYANNAADPGDYDIGEKINYFGNGKPLRYMYKPSLDGTSADCWYAGVGNLNVHYSSGVGNHFFYLLAEGSADGPKASPTCGAPAVTGVGRDKAAKIYYRALSTYFVSTTNYASARAGSLSAAADLYGKCGTEYRAVNAAWAGAGVKAATDPCGTTPPTTPPPSTPPTTPPGGTYENTTDVAIADNKTVTSTITVSGRTGNAPATLKVSVDIKHTYIGDLVVDLIAPDGTAYNLHNRTGGSTANLLKTVTVNASSETANGAWKLRVADKASGDTGKIDAWSLQF